MDSPFFANRVARQERSRRSRQQPAAAPGLSNLMLNGLQARPGPSGLAAQAQQAPPQGPRVRLIAFYQIHNRSKLPDVDAVLLKYKGREERLFELLEKKYGVSTRQRHQLPPGVPARGNGACT